MKNQNIIYGMTLITLLSACGINGKRGEDTAAEAQATTAIEEFRNLDGDQTSIGETHLSLVTGTLNASDPDFYPIGQMDYEITKIVPVKTTDSAKAEGTVYDAEASFPVYFSFSNSSPTASTLVAVVSSEAKAVLATGKIRKDHDNHYAFNPISVCDTYGINTGYVDPVTREAPFAGMPNFAIRCNLETGSCQNEGGVQERLNVVEYENDKKTFVCRGNRKDFFQTKMTIVDSETVTRVKVTLNPNGGLIPLPKNNHISSGSKGIVITESTLNFKI